nr:collagen alpha-1(I) chain-like [Globicephala melas]
MVVVIVVMVVVMPRQQAATLVLPKRPRGAPSPSGGRLLAQASRPRALFLDIPVCTQCPVHTMTRPTRSAPTSSEMTRMPAPRPPPSACRGPCCLAFLLQSQPRPALERGGCKRPGVQTAVRPPGVRQSQGGSGWADPGEVSGVRGLLVGSLSPLGRSGVCWNPGLAGDRLSLCSQASPGAAWGRTLAHGALIPSPVQCWAVEPCEVSAGAWLRLGSSQPAPRAARPPEGEAERRRGGPTVRGGAGGGGPGAGPSRAGPGRLGGAGPAGGGGRVVRTTDRLLVSGAQPSAASPAQGTRPGRARGKVTATVTWGRPAGSRAASGTRECSGKSRAGTGLKARGSGARAEVRRLLVPSTSHSPHQRPGCVRRGAPVSLGEGNPFHCELAAWLPGPSGRTRGRTEPNVSPAPRGHATYTCGLITLPNPAAGSPEPSACPLVTQRGAEHTGGSSSAPRGSSSASPRRRGRDWAAAAGPPVSPRRPASPRPDPAGLPARAAGTSSPQCPGGHPGARPGGGEPGEGGGGGGGWVRLHAECGGRTARRASVGAGAPRAPPGAPGPLAEAAPSGAL